MDSTSSEELRWPRMLWKPDAEDAKYSSTEALLQKMNRKYELNLKDYHDLQAWSASHPTKFWAEVWDTVGMIYEGEYSSVVDESAPMDSIPDWFPGVRFNYAEQTLFSRGPIGPLDRVKTGKEDSKIALTSLREGATEKVQVTWGEFRQLVGRASQALRKCEVKEGDRIAGIVSNSLDAIVLFMATVTIGAIYTTTAPDIGTQGALGRMVQIEPTYIFMDDMAVYNRKTIDLRLKIKETIEGMKHVKGFRGVVTFARFKEYADISGIPRCQTYSDFLRNADSDELVFNRLPFRAPFYIVYSSGTTGKPKCIAHCGGGVALATMKDCIFQHNVGPDCTYFQYTSTSWIMYLAQCAGLLVGAHIVLYDGSPFVPTPHAFISVMGNLKITHLGSGPRYFTELQKRGLRPRELTDLSNLRMVTSTGMVLSKTNSSWFYDEGFPTKAHLVNMTGGTELGCAMALGNLMNPVYEGECQGLSLGIAVEVYEVPEDGVPLPVKGKSTAPGVPGELVITRPFPSMPVKFWGKDGAKQYHNSYFTKFDGTWTQSDYCRIHPTTKGLVMLGRSDGVLNPSGVRFGSAEIYLVLEHEFPEEISDAIVVGQRRPNDLDEHVVLFLQMKPSVKFTPILVKRVKDTISHSLSKRHVPKYIFETPDIPVSHVGKKVEISVKHILCGRNVTPSTTLANPESLDFYRKFVDIEKMAQENMAKL